MSLIAAPAVVRYASLMPVRGVIARVPRCHYGFIDRLWVQHRYLRGELHGRGLEIAVEKHLGLMPTGLLINEPLVYVPPSR